MSWILCKLPKAGLGNQLFPLMKAFVFGELNQMPVRVSDYRQFKIGPYLRGEKVKRNYSGNFKFQESFFDSFLNKGKLAFAKNGKKLTAEPPLEKLVNPLTNIVFVFNRIPGWKDYFAGLKNHRELVIKLFYEHLNERILESVKTLVSPVIGVHIRMGDYRPLKPGEDFSKVGVVRTPLKYFVENIKMIRQVHGSNLPVSVFSDGYAAELAEILQLENVKLVEGNRDIVDLILLSRSKLIITSAGSTFSYWAGFLSDAPLLIHPDHLHSSVRPEALQEKYYEGRPDFHNEKLLENIRAIKQQEGL